MNNLLGLEPTILVPGIGNGADVFQPTCGCGDYNGAGSGGDCLCGGNTGSGR